MFYLVERGLKSYRQSFRYESLRLCDSTVEEASFESFGLIEHKDRTE